MKTLIITGILLSMPLLARTPAPADCCKKGKTPCCSEACCKASDHCCKEAAPKACAKPCKEEPATHK